MDVFLSVADYKFHDVIGYVTKSSPRLDIISISISTIIPEQFTVKAHPALFEGEGEPKSEAHFYSSLQCIYTFKTQSKHIQSNISETVRDREKV